MAQCTAHMQLKSVYGASCHREPGPPISFQRSEGLGSRLPMRTSVYLVRERPHKNRIAPTYLVPVPDTLLHHILCWYQLHCCTISRAGTKINTLLHHWCQLHISCWYSTLHHILCWPNSPPGPMRLCSPHCVYTVAHYTSATPIVARHIVAPATVVCTLCSLHLCHPNSCETHCCTCHCGVYTVLTSPLPSQQFPATFLHTSHQQLQIHCCSCTCCD